MVYIIIVLMQLCLHGRSLACSHSQELACCNVLFALIKTKKCTVIVKSRRKDMSFSIII